MQTVLVLMRLTIVTSILADLLDGLVFERGGKHMKMREHRKHSSYRCRRPTATAVGPGMRDVVSLMLVECFLCYER